MLHTATSRQIRDGLVTDVYFERTEQIRQFVIDQIANLDLDKPIQ